MTDKTRKYAEARKRCRMLIEQGDADEQECKWLMEEIYRAWGTLGKGNNPSTERTDAAGEL